MLDNVRGLLTVAGLSISICESALHKSPGGAGMQENQLENDADED